MGLKENPAQELLVRAEAKGYRQGVEHGSMYPIEYGMDIRSIVHSRDMYAIVYVYALHMVYPLHNIPTLFSDRLHGIHFL